MEWLQQFFYQENILLFFLIVIIIGVFAFFARKTHLNHIERIKKIDQGYNPKPNSKTFL